MQLEEFNAIAGRKLSCQLALNSYISVSIPYIYQGKGQTAGILPEKLTTKLCKAVNMWDAEVNTPEG